MRIDHFSIEGMLLGVRQVSHGGGVLDCREMNRSFVRVPAVVGFLGGASVATTTLLLALRHLLVGWCQNSGAAAHTLRYRAVDALRARELRLRVPSPCQVELSAGNRSVFSLGGSEVPLLGTRA